MSCLIFSNLKEMKEKFSTSTHPGNFPIRVLRHNITSHFESVGNKMASGLIFEAVIKGKVKDRIDVKIEKEPLKCPYADCGQKKICLQENYIGFIWAMCYSLFVIYEEGVQKRIISGQFAGFINFDTPLLKRAKQLFDWAISLKDSYSDWDLNLPNPEKHYNETEEWYAGKVNGIFLDIIIYQLFHEFAHLVNNHCSALSDIFEKKTSELTEEQIVRYKEIESEADNYAFESIIEESDSEKYKLHKGVAIILSHCTNLFIVKNPKSVKQQTHPDIDNRILSSIQKLGLKDVSSSDYLWYLGALSCKFFFDLHKIDTDILPSETTRDLFFRYLNVFDDIKK